MIRDFAQSGKDAHAVAVDVGRVAKAAVPGSQGRGVIDGEEGGIGEELFQAAEFVILGIHEELGTEDLFPVGDGGQGGVDLLASGFGRFRSGKRQTICSSSAQVSSIPGITSRPGANAAAACCTAWTLPAVLWSQMAMISNPANAESPATVAGVMSFSPQGERQVWMCRS